MSTSKPEKSRRGFIKTIGGAVVGLIVGAGLGYSARGPTAGDGGATVTVTKTSGAPSGPGLYSIPNEGDTVHERLMNAMKFVIERDGLKGKELTIMHPGGGSAAYDAVKDEFERETGMKFVHAEVPVNEVFDEAIIEAVSKSGDYDFFSLQPTMLGDLVESGLVMPLTSHVNYFDNEFRGRPNGFIYPLDRIMPEYKGDIYGILQDGDVFTNYYMHLDKLNSPQEQEGFEKQYGYQLKFADTFREYLDIGEYFYRPDEGFYGISELRSALRCYIVWFVYYSSKKFPTMLPFDENMNPLLESQEGINATEEFVEAAKYMPEENPSWDYHQVYTESAAGNIFQEIQFPSLSNRLNDPAESKVLGNWGTAVVPGSKVTGPEGKEIILKRTVQGAGWILLTSNFSKMKDLATLYSMWLTSPEKIVTASTAPGSWMDPCRYNQVGPNAHPKMKQARGPILEKYDLNASIAAPVLCGIRGGMEYATTLSRNLHATMLGTYDPAECMERTAREWQGITDDIGRNEQIESWKKYMGNYPTLIV